MVFRQHRLSRALLAATALTSATATPLFAQEGPAADDGETIVVTGSRIQQRSSYDLANPLVAVTAEELEQSGNVQLVDTLRQNPALISSFGGAQTSGSNSDFGAVGVQLLNLRGLGEDRTLVLVNGRRHVASLSGTAAVDINTIPNDLIESVDVLTGGASAIYGADGVSGVVNFRLKRDFDGFKANGQIGISSRGDAGQRYGSLTYGKNFADGRGNIALSYEFREQDRLSSFDRERTGNPLKTYGIVRNPADFPDDPNVPDRLPFNDLRYADSSLDGAIDFDFDGIPEYTGSGKVYDRGMLLPSSGGLTQGGDSTPLAGYQGDLQAYNRVHNFNLLSHYDFSDAFKVFFEAKYVKNRTFTLAQPSFDFYTYLTPDNPYLQDRFAGIADTSEGALISRDNFDLGVRGERNDRETMRFVGGFEGDISDHAKYELSYTFGQTKSKILLTDYRIGDRYFAAVDAVRDPATGQIVCRSDLDPTANIDPNNYDAPATTFTPGAGSGCRPLNLLGNGVRDQAALDWVNADIVNRAKVQQHVVSGSISGDFGQFFELPGGPVGFALGAEYRKEKSSFVPDKLLQQGALADFSLQLPEQGSFDVKEIFGELSVPVLKDMPFAYNLTFGAALRLSDYSTVGKTTTWKVDGTYAPIPDISFRGTWSEAVRAPNITELFAPRNGGFSFISDPCDPVYIDEGTQYRVANCKAALTALGLTPDQIAAFNPENDPQATVSLPGNSGGNRNLREETARTWTAGVVLRPGFIPGLIASFDWYDIKLKNAINTPTAEELAELCVDQPTLDNVYCQNVSRAPDTGYINGYFVSPQNVANFRTSGADIKLNYQFATAKAGSFSLSLVGGYLDKLEFIATPGADVNVDREEAYYPKWNATGDITWKLDKLTVNYGISWFSKTLRYTTEQTDANPDIAESKYLKYKEKWQHDLYVAYDVDDHFRFYVGANNLFDQQPSIASSNYPISYVGRYMYAGAKITM
ncbi:outer membrane receptor protein involved in Fe transport [Sphingobium sp. OAS761]|uniref:TonB-dependent receptor domain-containing protein n=1 Tax=Sphingobium sp. OAS761 TaxID=2817901 RepID=UPI00209CF119|nr:TonB-dependent receptor [Sphingobium sp. OAS761]MCP1468553.1 outer membrane receptor protein involved in Fe transport [Sphingobium sp. OAS761]